MEVLEDLMAATGELLWEWDTRHRRGMRAPPVDSDYVKKVRMAYRRAEDILLPGRPLTEVE